MKLQELQKIVNYAIEQAKDGCGILDDTTGKGYDSTEYYGQQQDALNAIQAELNELEMLLRKEDDIWHGSMYVVGTYSAVCTINEAAYDAYGELYRQNNNEKPTVNAFIAVIRSNDFLYDTISQFTNDALANGYDIISDDYNENELLGCHDAKGHFIK